MHPKLLIALTLILTLTLSLPALADGYNYMLGSGWASPDTNSYVPEYFGTVGTCDDGILGVTNYEYDPSAWYGPHVMWITYDSCEMNRLGAGESGWQRLIEHERAHARGWAHYEGTPETNAAYYPTQNVHE